MKATICSVFCCFFALLISVTSSVGDDRIWLNSVVNLVEMDFEDTCAARADATWDELLGSPKGLAKKLERDKAFGMFVQRSFDDVKAAFTQHAIGQNDEILRRKVHLLMQPGDVMLDTDQWLRLVTFADTAQNKLRFATNYDCGANTNCTLREFHNSFARQTDENKLLTMKESWERNLPDMTEYLEQILPLLRNSSKGYNNVEEYWDSLVEYEGAILKARELWDSIKPLYTKLHKYIALRLLGDDAVGGTLKVHVLRSLKGDDWSNVIESLLPKHPAIYQKVTANLQLKNLGGVHAFKAAADLIKELDLGEIKPEIWSQSVFNGTCPSTLVDWCHPNKMRVATCKDVSIGNYLDAHETAMKIIYKQTTASYSNNTYILREAARYSAIYEAIPGFLSLLALSPHAIARNDLFSVEIFNYNANHHRMILQLILALRDLPRLNYYMAADEWRLKILMGKIQPSEAATSWADLRKEFSMLEVSGVELLSDPYVVFNKPFIGKFMGLILKYQIYQSFAEEMESDESDLVKHVSMNNGRLGDVMLQGFSVKWPELVSELLAKKENGLEYTGLTDYYRLLDEYLDSHFDTTYNVADAIDDYLEPEPAPTEEDDFDLGENPVVIDEAITDHPDEINLIDTGDGSLQKDGVETTPVAVMEVKNQNPNPNPEAETTKEASYNVYWWISIVVAVAVVVVLIAIIAKKRHNHRKELERQRRDNSRA